MTTSLTITDETITQIAHTAYNVTRVYCTIIGDPALPEWKSAPDTVKSGYMLGVKAKLEQNLTPAQQHQLWCKTKLDQGWTYGKVKDDALKYHPNLVTYSELSEAQRFKDRLFHAVVDSFAEQP